MIRFRQDSKGNRLWRGEYERADGRYEYRYVDRMGESHEVYAHRLSALRIEEMKISYQERMLIMEGMESVSLNDRFDIWIASKMNLRENTRQCYIYTYNHYVRNSLGKEEISEITTFDIKSHYISLMHNQKLSVETIGHIQNVLFQVFQSAVEDNSLIKNPADRAIKEFTRKHSKHVSKRSWLTHEQQIVFEDFIKNTEGFERWYPIFYTLIHTGLRVGEFTSLCQENIDMKNGKIIVNHAMSYLRNPESGKGCYKIYEPKTEAGKRIIPMDRGVILALNMEKEYQKEHEIVSEVMVDGYSTFVFLNRFGRYYTQKPLNEALSKIVQSYNLNPKRDAYGRDIMLPHITCHSLRHTFARILCENNVNIKVMQRLLGHADIETTMQIYTEISNDFLFREYMNKVIHN